MLIMSRGKIDDAIGARLLYAYKDSLYWWASRLIPRFSSLWATWHTQLTAHINLLGLQFGISTYHPKKNNLTVIELSLFFKHLGSFTRDIKNWQQHYLGWTIMCITGMRPGSFTVAPGYEEGADMGDGKTKRSMSATLYWEDVEFLRIDGVDGIVVRVNFKYDEEHNPFANSSRDTARQLTFIPIESDRHELDLSALFLAIGWSRGLFPHSSWRELFEDMHRTIPKNADINKLPVFAAADQASGIDPTKPMREFSLVSKLKEMCLAVGLLDRNTTYSWRRTALVARELAGHLSGFDSIYSDDAVGLNDMDISAMRLGFESMSRDDLRAALAQAVVSRVDIENDPTMLNASLTQQLKEEARAKLLVDLEYVAHEKDMTDFLHSITDAVGAEPLAFTHGYMERHRALLRQHNKTDLLAELDTRHSARLLLIKRLMKKHGETCRADMLRNYQDKASKMGAASTDIFKSRHQPGPVRESIRQALEAVKPTIDNTSAAIQNLSTDLVAEGEDIDLSRTEDDQAALEEPVDSLPNDVVLQADGEETKIETNTTAAREEFIKNFAGLAEEAVNESGLAYL